MEGERTSSSGRFLHIELRLTRCKRDAKEVRGRVGITPVTDPGVALSENREASSAFSLLRGVDRRRNDLGVAIYIVQ